MIYLRNNNNIIKFITVRSWRSKKSCNARNRRWLQTHWLCLSVRKRGRNWRRHKGENQRRNSQKRRALYRYETLEHLPRKSWRKNSISFLNINKLLSTYFRWCPHANCLWKTSAWNTSTCTWSIGPLPKNWKVNWTFSYRSVTPTSTSTISSKRGAAWKNAST